MNAMTSQITGVAINYSAICSDVDKQNSKAPRHWTSWGEFTGHRWIPHTKGQLREIFLIGWRHYGGRVTHKSDGIVSHKGLSSFVNESVFQDVVCRIVVILFRPLCAEIRADI